LTELRLSSSASEDCRLENASFVWSIDACSLALSCGESLEPPSASTMRLRVRRSPCALIKRVRTPSANEENEGEEEEEEEEEEVANEGEEEVANEGEEEEELDEEEAKEGKEEDELDEEADDAEEEEEEEVMRGD